MRRAERPSGLRPAALLLPVALLAGCSVFQAGGSAPAGGAGWEQHDGYSLRCVDVARASCEETADQMAARHRAERDDPIMSIVVDPADELTLCWASTAGNRCTSANP